MTRNWKSSDSTSSTACGRCSWPKGCESPTRLLSLTRHLSGSLSTLIYTTWTRHRIGFQRTLTSPRLWITMRCCACFKTNIPIRRSWLEILSLSTTQARTMLSSHRRPTSLKKLRSMSLKIKALGKTYHSSAVETSIHYPFPPCFLRGTARISTLQNRNSKKTLQYGTFTAPTPRIKSIARRKNCTSRLITCSKGRQRAVDLHPSMAT